MLPAVSPSVATMARVCRYCACDEPLEGSGWQDPTHTLCTACAGAEAIAERMVGVLAELAQQASTRIRLIAAPWGDLSLEERRALVATCCGIVDMISDTLAAQLEADATVALIEISAIAEFFRTKCPRAIQDGEPLSGAVIRLLAPHVGARIVLP